ncbi:MAG TPA: HAMP domain-containing sensor histidine kinase [Candidatus Gastranaerophilales bacterium]|nr:HAMP domain-containing sensor histidine kinase [Candidatus Gastranaerophilales bacterium]
MKRQYKNNLSISIKELMSDIDQDSYTNQTILSLSRCFLETIIENKTEAVILVKIKQTKDFGNLLDRLKYTDIAVYSYSENVEGFKKIECKIPQMENDEFFVIAAERFTACLCWNMAYSELSGLCEGFCSLNPMETKTIIEHLQTVAYNADLEKDLEKVLQDRRNNEKFTTILRKIVSDLENRQRDLICANAELKEFYEKSGENEKLASISQMFSTVMHELRNPLSSIDLHSKIISKKLRLLETEDHKMTKEIQDSIEVVSRTTSHLEELLNELLNFSKPLSLKKSQLNLEDVINEIINLIKPLYDNKNVELIFQNSVNKNLLVNFDRAKLHQVIFNILKNALEVSESGKKVKISLTNEQDNICVKIIDQGSGISEESRKKIFEPYFTTKKEGTGLGLAQSKKIIEAHEGVLYVDPEYLNGCAFIIKLPATSLEVNI